MHLDAIWDSPRERVALLSRGERDGIIPADYLRAVSTGPATPLVLSITTVHERVRIGLSYRTTVYSPADIEQMQRAICGEC